MLEKVNCMWKIYRKNGLGWEGNPWGCFIFLCCFCVFCCCFCSMFSWFFFFVFFVCLFVCFYSYFVEFLAAFKSREMFGKKVVFEIFKSSNQQFVSSKIFWIYLEGFIFGKVLNFYLLTWRLNWGASWVAFKDCTWILTTSSRTAINGLLRFLPFLFCSLL